MPIRPMLLRLLLVASALAALAACSGEAVSAASKQEASTQAGRIDAGRLAAADREPQNWFTTGRDGGEQHYSPLQQVDASSVARLGFAWEYDATPRRGRVARGQQATPVVVDGVMYTSAPWGEAYALDAASGRELWRYVPELDGAWARKACCDVVNRGVAVWNGKVYVGQLDGWLVALDAATGTPLWKVDTLIDRSRGYTLTGAPRVAGDKIVIGNGGAEFGVRGYITAYDLETGAQRWRFFTVPGDPAKGYEHPELASAASTWDADSDWDAGGGGTVWDSMVYDAELDLLYVGTGNGSPHPVWLRSPGRRDNLYVSSILAISPADGRLAWHYQVTPGDSWDYTATQPIVLADLQIEGRTRKVLMQAPKNGFFYVIDRSNGALISAEKYVTTTWADRVDLATGRPVLNAQADYSRDARLIYPSPLGGHNWMPMAFSPQTGLVYLPVIDMATAFQMTPGWTRKHDTMTWGSNYLPLFLQSASEQQRMGAGQPAPRYVEYLLAWDPVAQREVWRVPLSGSWNGGTLATAGGLVVQGSSSGHLRAYRASDGALLKEIFLGTGIMAAPMSYAIDGTQYIAVAAGYGGLVQSGFHPEAVANTRVNSGRMLAFRLDGSEAPVAALREPPLQHPLPEQLFAELPTRDAGRVAEGAATYAEHCMRCHRGGLNGTLSGFPDLFNMPEPIHGLFSKIVLDGMMSAGGMAAYSDVLSPRDVENVHAWIVETARLQRAGQKVDGGGRVH
ncbi:PQQ-dependent dehydrogenase, methanol/ethanol family [Luteimonas sp. RIT-PG2_3]